MDSPHCITNFTRTLTIIWLGNLSESPGGEIWRFSCFCWKQQDGLFWLMAGYGGDVVAGDHEDAYLNYYWLTVHSV